MKFKLLFILLLLFNITYSQQQNLAQLLSSRQLLLPDISVIGDIQTKFSTDENEPEKNKIKINEIELAIQGYLYPDIRADIFLAMHKHNEHIEPEVCEAKISFLKIFPNLSAEVGKIHVNFGKINKIHQHHRPYIDQPQVITNFLGEHGLVAEGTSLSYLLPLPFFAQIELGIWWLPGHYHENETEEQENKFSLADEVYTGKLWLSFPLSGESELELGINGAKGKGAHYTHHKDEAEIISLDLTYKLLPSAYKRLILQNEFLYLIREVPIGVIKRFGFYSYLGYKFNKYWSTGIRYDDTEDAFPHLDDSESLSVEVSEKTSSISLITTRNLTETTYIRGQYKYYFEGLKNTHELFLQIIFGMGPHSHTIE